MELSCFESIQAFAKRVNQLDRLDAVIENAGVGLLEFTLSAELETTLIINVVGTILLAFLILPKLQTSAERAGQETHLALVGSGAAFEPVGVLEKIDENVNVFNNLSTANKEMAKGWHLPPLHATNGQTELTIPQRYPVTKLIQLYLLRELASRVSMDQGVVINYVNPCFCKTDFERHAGFGLSMQLFILDKIMGRTAEQGSRTVVHALQVGEDCHGKYVSECENKDHYVPEWITNESGKRMQQRLWNDLNDILKERSFYRL